MVLSRDHTFSFPFSKVQMPFFCIAQQQKKKKILKCCKKEMGRGFFESWAETVNNKNENKKIIVNYTSLSEINNLHR